MKETMPKEAEIIIIGGGIIGVAIAYYLTKQGKKDIMLIEKKEVASEASGAHATFCTLSSGGDWLLHYFSQKSIAEYMKIDDSMELGRDIEFNRKGLLVMIETERSLELWKESLKVRQEFSPQDRIVTREEVAELEPNVNPIVKWGLHSPYGGHINPFPLIMGMVDKAKQAGMKVMENTEVTDIRSSSGRIRSVITSRGEVEGKYIVNAAGRWALNIGRMVGLELPITTPRHQMLVTEIPKNKNILNRQIISGGYREAQILSEEEKKASNEETVALAAGHKKGNLLLGITGDPASEDRRVTFTCFQNICRQAIKYIPMLGEQHVHIIRSYANHYANTPDRHQILGTVEGLDGFILACGMNDYGFQQGAIIGKVISEIICYGESQSIPEEVMKQTSVSRFL